MKTNIQKYPAYKDSGVEWLGKIPNHWEIIRLKNIIRAKITDGPHVTPEFIDEGIPFLSVDGIQNGELVFENSRLISLNDHIKYQKKCRIEKFDILMGKAASIGKIAQSKVDFEYSIWSPLALIKPNLEKFNATFMEYYLKSTLSQYQIEILCTSNTQKNISMDDIPKIILTFPPLPEQTAIAAFLDRKTTLIDQAIGIKQKQIELLKERRQILIHNAVTRGLNPNVKMKDSGVEYLGDIPKEWNVVRFKYIIRTKARLGWKGLKASEYVDNSDYGFLATPNIKGENIDYSGAYFITKKRYEESPEIMLKKDDILLVKDGSTLGIINIVKSMPFNCTVNSSIAVLRILDDNLLNAEYLNYFLKSDYSQKIIELKKDGMGVPHLFQSDINNFIALIPTFKEQKEILIHIEKQITKTSTAISLKEQEIEKLKEYKATLINSAVTGKIKVS